MTEQIISTCRLCAGSCGVLLEVEDNRVVAVIGDHEHVLSRGYACIKGLNSGLALYAKDRVLKPLKRMQNGDFEPISLTKALDEIADKTRKLLDSHGPGSIATFKGTQAYLSHTLAPVLRGWMEAIGSPNLFSTMTIDQSAKLVAMGRLGYWGAGRHHFQDSDAVMIVGGNPLVSIAVQGITPFNMTKQFKDARKRGMQLIVIDPRLSETAKIADIHLPVKPGQDAILLAAIIREILINGWQDSDFCRHYVNQLEALRSAVEPFQLDLAEKRTGVDQALIQKAARVFAKQAKKGFATTGTGPSMAPFSNLSEHLVETLNVICGRFNRAGDSVRNPGLLRPVQPVAQVIPPARPWEYGPKSSVRGFGLVGGEMPSATLPEEILDANEDKKIRSLFVSGGNPALAFPDQSKIVTALQSLELLVVIDPYMTATAELADYIIPPTTMYEREDVLLGPDFEFFIPELFQQYVPAAVAPPEGSELIDDWRFYWELCRRLDVQLNYFGHPLDMTTAPTSDELLEICMEPGPLTVADLKAHPRGKIFDLPTTYVQPGRVSPELTFQVMPDDVASELKNALEHQQDHARFTLIPRRLRATLNTLGLTWPGCRKRQTNNPLWLHPADAKSMGVAGGDTVTVTSDYGAIQAVVEIDDSTLPGVVAMTHCWGTLPEKTPERPELGVCTNRLTTIDKECESINAMPWISAIPVTILKSL